MVYLGQEITRINILSIPFKVVGTAVSFADASTQCANLATGGLLAAPKSEAILNTINNLNPDGEDVWVGLDDRCIA